MPTFARPEWVTVYLTAVYVVIAAFTLIAIWRQSKLARATLAAQFRPKVIVRTIKLDPITSSTYDGLDNKLWKIQLQVTNSGGTIARVLKCVVFSYLISEAHGMGREDVCTEEWENFTLIPGERRQLDLKFTSEDFRAALHVMEYAISHKEKQYTWPVCAGTITYLDDNGFTRETGFLRSWDVKSRRFNASTDPECEYAD